MISKLQVGKYYEIFGIGLWSTIRQDTKIVAVTTASEIETLNIPLYDTWFKPYEIPEEYYQKIINENSAIYQCKTLDSRDPKILNDASGSTFYIFPDMISYADSNELIECKIYSWEIRTSPYKEYDEFNPMLVIPEDLSIQSIINESLSLYIYDTIVVYRNEEDIIVSDEEYAELTNARNSAKSHHEARLDNIESELQQERRYMNGVVTSIREKEEALRVSQVQADDFMTEAVKLYNKSIQLQLIMQSKEMSLRNKYGTILDIVSELNEILPYDNRIMIPSFDMM